MTDMDNKLLLIVTAMADIDKIFLLIVTAMADLDKKNTDCYSNGRQRY